MDRLPGLMDQFRTAVDEMDRCLGWRNTGVAVSGTGIPSFKHIATHEDPPRFTIRVLISPTVSVLGYGPMTGPFVDRPVETVGTMMAFVGMNRPLESHRETLIDAMRQRGCDRGIVTDGFRWVLVRRVRDGYGMMGMDLRPYYLEALESKRFRTAVRRDTSDAERFVRLFGPPGGPYVDLRTQSPAEDQRGHGEEHTDHQVHQLTRPGAPVAHRQRDEHYDGGSELHDPVESHGPGVLDYDRYGGVREGDQEQGARDAEDHRPHAVHPG